jgi:hypothetical protein
MTTYIAPRIHTREEIDAMTDTERKVLDNLLRRAADRQGLNMQKSRARDPHHLLYGTYQLVDITTGGVTWSGPTGRGYGLTLVDVEQHLFGQPVA